MCAVNNRQVVFHPFTRLETALEGLETGRYQLVVSDIPATAEMKDRYLFVRPVGIDRQVLVQRRDSSGNIDIHNQFDLAKRQVTVPAGSPFISRLHNLSREIGDTIYITEDPEYSSEQLIVLTALGEVHNVVVNAGGHLISQRIPTTRCLYRNLVQPISRVGSCQTRFNSSRHNQHMAIKTSSTIGLSAIISRPLTL